MIGKTFRDVSRGLVNAITGAGTTKDKSTHGTWEYQPLDRMQLENMYRSNWMCRKAVDIPAFDMMREGWTWQADKNTIEAIEAETQRLKVRKLVLQAMIQARLYGGSAIFVSDGSVNPSEPLNIERVGKGGIKFFLVLDRYHVTSGELNTDPLSGYYLMPRYYDLVGVAQGSVRIHPSRVIRFIGNELPHSWEELTDRWGDSILDAVESAIRNATAGEQGIAALVQEAKIDVFRIKGLMQNVRDEVYQDAVKERFRLVNQLKSIHNAVVLDADDEYTQKTISFTQLPEVQRIQLQIVSGAVDIPATRFLSQSPAGLSSTGESDLENYYNRIGAEQKLYLSERLDQIFQLVVRSALGSYPSDIYYTFNPLWQISAKTKSEIAKTMSETFKADVDMGLIPMPALSQARGNYLIESGEYPGIEAAIEEYKDYVPEGMPNEEVEPEQEEIEPNPEELNNDE